MVGVVHLWTATVWDNGRERAPKGSSYLFGPVALPSHGRGRAVHLRDGKGRKCMLDLSNPDVGSSTRNRAASWENLPYVREGLLTLWDAANLLDPEGYGGIYETCAKATQQRITGFYDTLKQSLTGSLPGFLGYAPVAYRVEAKTAFGVEELPLFPGMVFLEWFEQHKQKGMDGRYFERYRYPLARKLPSISSQKNPFWGCHGERLLTRNNPYCWDLSRKRIMSVRDFSFFYVGSDGSKESREEDLRLATPLMGKVVDEINRPPREPGEHVGGNLFGYVSLNKSNWPIDLEFPVGAYVAFLEFTELEMPPEWQEYEREEYDSLPPVEPLSVQEESSATVEPVEARETAGANACGKKGRTASDDIEILDGLTLADFKRYLESNPPLKHVLPIVVRTLRLPEGDREKTSKALTAKLRRSAKQDGWGTCHRCLADAQGEAIDKMFLPVGKVGSGNKKALRILPAKEYEKEK